MQEVKINIHEFMKKFNAEYDFLYNARGVVAGAGEAAEAFDKEIVTKYPDFVGEFIKYRGDFISSDREAAAFAFAFYDMFDN